MNYVSIDSHTDEVKGELAAAIANGLEKCGMLAESYAKQKCPVDTGALRNSITHSTAENETIIGTNMEYAVYVEMGTGRAHVDGGSDMVNGHAFVGQAAQPYLKPALEEHGREYREIFNSALNNA